MRKILFLLCFSISSILFTAQALAAEDPAMTVKLSTPKERVFFFQTSTDGTVSNGTKNLSVKKETPFFIFKLKDQVMVRVGNRLLRGKSLRITPKEKTDTIEITDWKRTYSWDTSGKINDNVFQGSLIIYPENTHLLIVNDLPLSLYMKGIAEVPENDPNEKRKAMTVLSRSYAAYYADPNHKKFSDTRFNASDDPQTFQKYLGYGFVKRSPLWQEALKTTTKEMLYYQDQVLRAAYSSCTGSLGRRRTPLEAGWKDHYFNETASVYAQVEDPLGIDLVRDKKGACGHGVGLSGLGATNMAKEGKSYREILEYYYKGVRIGE